MSGRGSGGRRTPQARGSPMTGDKGPRHDSAAHVEGGQPDNNSSGGAAPAPQASIPEFVVCAKHNARRKASYCVQAPVYDADHVVVRYQFECRDSEPCNVKAASAGNLSNFAASTAAGQPQTQDSKEPSSILAFDLSSSSAAHGRTGRAYTVQTPVSNADADAPPADPAHGTTEVSTKGREGVEADSTSGSAFQPGSGGGARSGGGGVPTRYYDMLERGAGGGGAGGHRGGAGFPTHKVCWNCGLPGHEKPDCPNGLCRACHAKRKQGEYHHCVDVTLSDFFASDVKLPHTADGLPATKCLYCGELGHLDCSISSSASGAGLHGGGGRGGGQGQTFCAFCGRRGHTSYDCGDRNHRAPDRYALRQQQLDRPWNAGSTAPHTGGYPRGNAVGTPHDPRRGYASVPTGSHGSPSPSGYGGGGGRGNSQHGGPYTDGHSGGYRAYNTTNAGARGGHPQDRRTGGRDHGYSQQSAPYHGNHGVGQPFPSQSFRRDREDRQQGGRYADSNRDRGYPRESPRGREDERRGWDDRRPRGSPTHVGGAGASYTPASHDSRRAGRKRYGSSGDDEGPLY